jgi:transcriptional regulator of met regulon
MKNKNFSIEAGFVVIFMFIFNYVGDALGQPKTCKNLAHKRCNFLENSEPLSYKVTEKQDTPFSLTTASYRFELALKSSDHNTEGTACEIIIQPKSLEVSRSIKRTKLKSFLKDNDSLLKNFQKKDIKRIIDADDYNKKLKPKKLVVNFEGGASSVSYESNPPKKQMSLNKKFLSLFRICFDVKEVQESKEGEVVTLKNGRKFMGNGLFRLVKKNEKRLLLNKVKRGTKKDSEQANSALSESLQKRRWNVSIEVNYSNFLLAHAELYHETYTGPLLQDTDKLKEKVDELRKDARHVIEMVRLKESKAK